MASLFSDPMPPLTGNDATDIHNLWTSHQYSVLAIVILIWLWRALADDSKFPITWPEKYAKWKPAVIIALGQAICTVKAISIDHVRWFLAIKDGIVVSGLALGAIHVFRLVWPNHNDEPKWLQWFVLVFNRAMPVLVTTVKTDEDPEHVIEEIEPDEKQPPK